MKVLRRRLDGATEEEDEGAQHDRQPATEVITSRSSKESAEEGSAREERDDRPAIKQQRQNTLAHLSMYSVYGIWGGRVYRWTKSTHFSVPFALKISL